jgi:hypothetical protein
MMWGWNTETKTELLRSESARTQRTIMHTNITWRTAVLTLVGLVAIATAGLNNNFRSRGLAARNTAVETIDCNIHDPASPCFAGSLGYPAGDLFVAYY